MPSFLFVSCVERAQARFAYILRIGRQEAYAPYLVVLSQENKHSDLRIERGFWLLEMRKAGSRRRFVKTYAQTPHCQGVFSSFFAIPDQRA
jgi:hypothetical protein